MIDNTSWHEEPSIFKRDLYYNGNFLQLFLFTDRSVCLAPQINVAGAGTGPFEALEACIELIKEHQHNVREAASQRNWNKMKETIRWQEIEAT